MARRHVVIVAALVAAACGGGGGTEPPPQRVSPATPPAPTAPGVGSGSGSPAAPGGHRVTGALVTGAEARVSSAEHRVDQVRVAY